jgi:hypothetical protein
MGTPELSKRSIIVTFSPANAHTWAMPLPIVPAPTTPVAASLARDRILADPNEVIAKAPGIVIGSWRGTKFRPEHVATRGLGGLQCRQSVTQSCMK